MKEKTKSTKKKSALKKIRNLLSFLIIVFFAGFVFYMGWIQIRIPEGKLALVHTKFPGGYDDQLLSPGQFIWRWENLLPTNMTIHFLELETRTSKEYFEFNLPSGELYGEFINAENAFLMELKLEYSYSYKREHFFKLLEKNHYTEAELKRAYDNYRDAVNNMVKDYLLKESSLENLPYLEKNLKLQIQKQEKDFTLESFSIQSIKIPDFNLYNSVSRLYWEQLEAKKKVDLELELIQRDLKNKTGEKMDLLVQYGDVLSQYPVLLEYFKLEKEKLDPGLFAANEN